MGCSNTTLGQARFGVSVDERILQSAERNLFFTSRDLEETLSLIESITFELNEGNFLSLCEKFRIKSSSFSAVFLLNLLQKQVLTNRLLRQLTVLLSTRSKLDKFSLVFFSEKRAFLNYFNELLRISIEVIPSNLPDLQSSVLCYVQSLKKPAEEFLNSLKERPLEAIKEVISSMDISSKDLRLKLVCFVQENQTAGDGLKNELFEEKYAEKLEKNQERAEERQDSLGEKDSFNEKQDSFEVRESSFEEKQDSFIEKQVSFIEKQFTFEEKQDSFIENQESFTENQASFIEKQVIFEEKQESFEEEKIPISQKTNDILIRENFKVAPLLINFSQEIKLIDISTTSEKSFDFSPANTLIRKPSGLSIRDRARKGGLRSSFLGKSLSINNINFSQTVCVNQIAANQNKLSGAVLSQAAIPVEQSLSQSALLRSKIKNQGDGDSKLGSTKEASSREKTRITSPKVGSKITSPIISPKGQSKIGVFKNKK